MSLRVPHWNRPAPERGELPATASWTALLRNCPDAGARAELNSLAAEGDAQLLGEGLLNFAQRQERDGRLELAMEAYQAVQTLPVEALRRRAQQGLDAIQGRGDFGPRAEFLLRNLAQQASEPSALLAMGVAGTAFRVTRLATLSWLAGAGEAGLATRLLGAGRIATLAGFAVEAPAFSLAARLGNEALGRPQDWGARALGRDLLSSYFVLGGLKLAGGAAGSLGAGRPRLFQHLIHQGGMLTGILLGHRLEEWAGLRPRQAGATTLVDSLALLLQFHVAGRLSRAAVGPGLGAWEASLEHRAANLALGRGRSSFPQFPGPPTPSYAMASAISVEGPRGGTEAGPRIPDRLYSVRLTGEADASSPTTESAANLPEVRALPGGRTRPVDRERLTSIRLIEAQGVAWVIDIDTAERNRQLEVWVGDHLLPPGGSLRVREGEVIRMGDRSYRFREMGPEAAEDSGNRLRQVVALRRHLHHSYGSEGAAHYDLQLGDFLEGMAAGEETVFATGPLGTARLRVLSRGAGEVGERFDLELRDDRNSFPLSLELAPDRFLYHHPPRPQPRQALLPMFADWVNTHAMIRAAQLEVRGISPEFHELLEQGLINGSYDRLEAREGRVDLITQPRSMLIPPEFGPQHRAAAERAFQAWAQRRLGRTIPTLVELEEGVPPPEFNHLGVEPSMQAILDRLVDTRSRFLEIGFGERTETLEAVERRGGVAWGLELDRVYPPGADRAQLQAEPVDVLFVNGSPFLFYAQHQVALPAALDILRQFPRAEWLVLQAYNPRTPFEILRHAEELNRMEWEPLYFRSQAAPDEAPLFPTDWCQRPDTAHAVLIARRVRR
ncbi:MAG: hypothetical protein U1F66_04720 [bacterium]